MHITKKLIYWYSENKRNLPWRESKSAFHIWLSEIILQQTRIDQGLSYYNRFITEYDSIYTLASAREEQILRLWQGLGYYSRARNLHIAARQVVNEYNGKFPKSHHELMKLKGVGDYTAAAIASMAFDEAVPAVDGNVKRVVARLFGLQEDIANLKTYRNIRKICRDLMGDEDPGTFNQAMMEFGALQCTPKNPNCEKCPLSQHCLAFQKNIVKELPVKYNKQKKRNRYFNYFIFVSKPDKQTFIEQRDQKDIWQKLFQFPMLETNKLINEGQASQQADEWLQDAPKTLIHSSGQFKHILSHQQIYARFFHFNLSHLPSKTPDNWKIINQKDMDNFAIPRLIEQYLEKMSPENF